MIAFIREAEESSAEQAGSAAKGQTKPGWSWQAGKPAAFLVVLNLTHRPCYFTPTTIRFTGVIVIDTLPEQEQVSVKDTIDLFGDEGMVIKLDDWESVSSNPPATYGYPHCHNDDCWFRVWAPEKVKPWRWNCPGGARCCR